MAFSFNGTNQHISSNSSPIGSSPAAFTLSARCRSTGTLTGGATLIGMGDSTNNNSFICLSAGVSNTAQLRFAIRNFNTTVFADISGGSGFDGQLHHLAGTWDGTTMRAYVDGVQVASTTPSAFTSVPLNVFSIGALVRTTVLAYLPSVISDVGVWTTALNADQIASLSKAISPGQVQPQSLVTDIPLIRNLQDVRNGLALTNNNGATVVDHPRLYQ